MGEIDRPGCDGNLLCFSDQLRWERDPARQEALKRLLIAEEDRFGAFGATEDRLRMVERKLMDGAELIVRQRRLIADMKSRGTDTSSAERTLRTFELIQDLFERLGALVRDAGGRPH
jgi:hypothetical protein